MLFFPLPLLREKKRGLLPFSPRKEGIPLTSQHLIDDKGGSRSPSPHPGVKKKRGGNSPITLFSSRSEERGGGRKGKGPDPCSDLTSNFCWRSLHEKKKGKGLDADRHGPGLPGKKKKGVQL